MAWTATLLPPPHPSPSSSWWPRRRWPRWASSTRLRRSCWTTLGAATTPWMKRRSVGCRPWRRTTCCCPSPTGSDTEGAATDKRNSSRNQETKCSALFSWKQSVHLGEPEAGAPPPAAAAEACSGCVSFLDKCTPCPSPRQMFYISLFVWKH